MFPRFEAEGSAIFVHLFPGRSMGVGQIPCMGHLLCSAVLHLYSISDEIFATRIPDDSGHLGFRRILRADRNISMTCDMTTRFILRLSSWKELSTMFDLICETPIETWQGQYTDELCQFTATIDPSKSPSSPVAPFRRYPSRSQA
jgi:hypothetical protein